MKKRMNELWMNVVVRNWEKNTVKENTLSLLTHAKANTALKLINSSIYYMCLHIQIEYDPLHLFLHVLSHDTTPNICISIFVDVDFLKQDFLSYTHHNIDLGSFQWPPFTISNDLFLVLDVKATCKNAE